MSHFKRILLCICGSAVLAFGLYQIHSLGVVTEGGVLGMTLLLHHWLNISPAVSGFVMNGICYGMGFRVLGKTFALYSALSGGTFSLFYAIFERFPLLWPGLAEHPLTAAVLGALFVGIGVGLCVIAGGAPSGDDALAMTISRVSKCPIERVYLISDLSVLCLSLSYMPVGKIVYSLITVVLSGQIIGLMNRPKPKK